MWLYQGIGYEKQVLKVYFRDDNDNEARAKNAEYRSAKISRETFEFLLPLSGGIQEVTAAAEPYQGRNRWQTHAGGERV